MMIESNQMTTRETSDFQSRKLDLSSPLSSGASNKYHCPPWSRSPYGLSWNILSKRGRSFSSLTRRASMVWTSIMRTDRESWLWHEPKVEDLDGVDFENMLIASCSQLDLVRSSLRIFWAGQDALYNCGEHSSIDQSTKSVVPLSRKRTFCQLWMPDLRPNQDPRKNACFLSEVHEFSTSTSVPGLWIWLFSNRLKAVTWITREIYWPKFCLLGSKTAGNRAKLLDCFFLGGAKPQILGHPH